MNDFTIPIPDSADINVDSGILGVGVTYYLSPGKPHFNFSGIFGFSRWMLSRLDADATAGGWGGGLYVGYEVFPHLNAEVGASYGLNKFDEDDLLDYECEVLTLRLTVGWLGY